MKFNEFLHKTIDERNLSEVVLFDNDLQNKITEYILDACKEFKASIRSVEFEENAIHVHYNYGKESPKDFLDDKNEVYKVVKEEVTDVLKDLNIEIKNSMRSSVSEGVATITFFCKR